MALFRERAQNPSSAQLNNQGIKEADQSKSTEHSSRTGETTMEENPYLAHLNKPNQASSALDGFIPGKTTAAQARKAEEGSYSPFNSKKFSQGYHDILAVRRKLPVHAQRQEFLDLVHSSQFVVFVGETGSGKTTQ